MTDIASITYKIKGSAKIINITQNSVCIFLLHNDCEKPWSSIYIDLLLINFHLLCAGPILAV